MRAGAAWLLLIAALPARAATEKKIDPPPRQPQQRNVSLDVKDAEVRDVLKSIQLQCRIKNLIVDPQVQGKATFYFRDVPCRSAIDAVLTTYGLKALVYSETLTAVERVR